jgi:hypothetical protein
MSLTPDNTAADLAPTVPGTPFEGGFYVGRLLVAGVLHALIVSPAAGGEAPEAMAWGERSQDVAGACSFFDGAANTAAMAAAGSALAQWAQGLQMNGYSDWYLPSRDELELLYRHLKPTEESNYRRYGDNPSSVPVGYPYSPDSPPQTPAEAFRAGAAEALQDAWYWSSTQFSPGYAWLQYFVDGTQYDGGKAYEGRARAVRRFKLSA